VELLAIGLAGAALLAALIGWARSSGLSRRIEELELASRRSAKNAHEGFEQALMTQRELLAQIAEGQSPTREMILEGRLWRDVDGPAARALVEQGARVLDVRTPGETGHGVIPGAVLIPIDALEARLRELPRDERPWLVYCAAGSRSAADCEFLASQGFARLHNLAAGVGAWAGTLTRPS
jgi:rhodanese-related sulfurtransferase